MDRAKACDMSMYNRVISWPALSKAVDMVLLKSSQNNYIDSTFRDKWANAQANNIRTGVWHFYHPNVDYGIQSKTFLDIYNTLNPKPKAIALDCEDISYKTSEGTWARVDPNSKQEYTLWVMNWLTVVERSTGVVPGIYTRKSFWDNWVCRSGEKFVYSGKEFTAPDWSRYWLWVANYYVTNPAIPLDWKTWKFWQWGTYQTDGIQTPVDADWYNGTVQDMDAWLGTPPKPPVTPPVDPVVPVKPTLRYKANATINIRSYPNTYAPIVGTVAVNSEVIPTDIDGIDAWVQIAPDKWVCKRYGAMTFLDQI